MGSDLRLLFGVDAEIGFGGFSHLRDPKRIRIGFTAATHGGQL